MKQNAVKEHGRSSLIEMNWNLQPLNSQKIAAIITYFGALEYYTERAIWKLKGVDPKEIRSETDSKAVSQLVSKMSS